MAADAVNFRLNQLQAELTFRHQENFVLRKQTSESRFGTAQRQKKPSSRSIPGHRTTGHVTRSLLLSPGRRLLVQR